MKREIIKIREDGTKVKITANISVSWADYDTANYTVFVEIMPKGKRKWASVYSMDDFEYRRATDRKQWIENKKLEYCSPEELLEAKLAVWEAAKPTL